MPDDDCVPADMCADQRGIDMNDFARRDPSLEKGLDGMLKDSPKPLDTLALQLHFVS